MSGDTRVATFVGRFIFYGRGVAQFGQRATFGTWRSWVQIPAPRPGDAPDQFMRYIIISDIHGNMEAFESVIESFSGFDEEEILCAGDIVGYGADPEECVDRVISIGARSVLGNHDAAVTGKTDIASFNASAREAVYWTVDRLSRHAKEYLDGLPFVFENGLFTVVHGTLHEPEEFIYMMSGAEAMRTFEILKTQVCFVGHSHVPGVFTLKNGKMSYSHRMRTRLEESSIYIVNAGSVGQPRDNDNRACYCVYDTKKKEIELCRVEYDISGAQNKIIESGLPPVLAERLAYGR